MLSGENVILTVQNHTGMGPHVTYVWYINGEASPINETNSMSITHIFHIDSITTVTVKAVNYVGFNIAQVRIL